MGLTAFNITGQAQWNYTATGPPLLTSNSKLQLFDELLISTGAGAIDDIHVGTYSLAASGTQDLDLNGTALKTIDGVTAFSITKLKGFLFVNMTTATADSIKVGPAPSNGLVVPWGHASGYNTIHNGGCLLNHNPSAAGLAVVAATTDTIRITNLDASNAAIVHVCIWGE